MTEDPVPLEVEAERATVVLQSGQDYYVPLAAAAAIDFHQAQGTAKAIVSREDYNDALTSPPRRYRASSRSTWCAMLAKAVCHLPSTLRPRASRAPPPNCI
jgi:hypothetical protein